MDEHLTLSTTASGDLVNKPTRQTAGDLAEAEVFAGIMSGSIPAGSPLRLQELAGQLGMSIMPVREAIRRLEALGLVEVVPHKGAWVRALTLQDLADTYFTRVNLECLAVRTAAGRFTPEHAQIARAALDEHVRARRVDDQVAARNAHERFHFALYEASGSAWLVRSIAPAWRNSERYRVMSMRDATNLEARAHEHEEMLELLVAGDAEGVAALLAHHLKTSADLVAAGLGAGEDDQSRLEIADAAAGEREPGDHETTP